MVASSSTGARRGSPTSPAACDAPVQPGTVLKLTLYQVSAGAPVIAQTGGKSRAASCADQTRTERGPLAEVVQAKQLVQAAIETRLAGHAVDREQHSWYIRLSARRAVGDRQRLARQ